MRALILAAGKSTRLYPLTLDRPKSLLEIEPGMYIIDYQIDALTRAGITEIVLVTGYYSDKLINHVKGKYKSVNFIFINNEKYESTNAAYSLWLAKDYLLGGDIIFTHSDVVFENSLIEKLLKCERSALAYKKAEHDEESGKLVVSNDGKVLRLGKKIPKSESTGEYLQIIKFNSESLKIIMKALIQEIENKGNINMFTIDIFNSALKEGCYIEAIEFPESRTVEIDTVSDYENAKKIWKNHDKFYK